jgi:tRNA A37 N6-isopentenylltransferase MiaA
MTWFKKDKEVQWLNAKDVGSIKAMAQKLVGNG